MSIDRHDAVNPVGIANADYEEAGYSHQGWLTPDQKYFLHGDELELAAEARQLRVVG